MGFVNRHAALVLLVVLMLLSPACGSSSAARTPSVSPSPSGSPTALGKVSDWLEYHGTSAHRAGPTHASGCDPAASLERAGRRTCLRVSIDLQRTRDRGH